MGKESSKLREMGKDREKVREIGKEISKGMETDFLGGGWGGS